MTDEPDVCAEVGCTVEATTERPDGEVDGTPVVELVCDEHTD